MDEHVDEVSLGFELDEPSWEDEPVELESDRATTHDGLDEVGSILEGRAEDLPPITAEGALRALQHSGIAAAPADGNADALVEYLAEERRILLGVDEGLWSDDWDDSRVDTGVVRGARITAIDREERVVVLQDAVLPNDIRRDIPLGLIEELWGQASWKVVMTESEASSEALLEHDVPVEPAPDDEPSASRWSWLTPELIDAGGSAILPVYITGRAFRDWIRRRF